MFRPDKRCRVITVLLLQVLCFGWLLSAPIVSEAQAAPPDTRQEVAGQLVVKLTDSADIDTVNARYNTKTLKALGTDKTYLLSIPEASALRFAQNMNYNGDVVIAEPNYKLYLTELQQIFIYYDGTISAGNGSTNVTQLNNQWAFQKINLAASQTLSKGENVTVAVIDTGVNTAHPYFNNRLLPGYNAITRSPDNVQDNNGHGTFVAGLVTQVAPAAKILPIKALSDNGEGTVFDAAEAIRYAANNNVRVINLSMGLYQPSKVLETAIRYAQSKGVVVVASAGNSDTSEYRYPASYSGVIGVAALDKDSTKADFSNYGKNATVAAPGVQVYSTYYTGGYGYGNGTSFAAPLVAGLAAQIWAKRPLSSANEVANRIKYSATSLATADYDYGALLGFGLINNYASLLN